MKPAKESATESLIVEQIGFAKQLAAQFYTQRSNFGFEREDFEGAAMLGLCDAARRFDPAKGEYFKTYCYFRIKGAMFDLLRNGAGVQRRQFNQIVANKTPAESNGKAPYKPSASLPYSFANSAHELVGLVNVLDGLSMMLHVTDTGRVDLSYAEERNPEEIAVVTNTQEYLRRLIDALPAKERVVVLQHYYEGQSLSEIGRSMDGLSRSWVCRLHQSAIQHLQEMVANDAERYAEHVAG